MGFQFPLARPIRLRYFLKSGGQFDMLVWDWTIETKRDGGVVEIKVFYASYAKEIGLSVDDIEAVFRRGKCWLPRWRGFRK